MLAKWRTMPRQQMESWQLHVYFLFKCCYYLHLFRTMLVYVLHKKDCISFTYQYISPYRKCRKKLEQKSQRRHLCPAQAGLKDELFMITSWNYMYPFDNLTSSASFCTQQILCFDCLVQIDASKTFLTRCQNVIKLMIKFIMLCLFCFCNSSDSETDGSIESEESELSVEDLEEVL